MIPAEPAPPQQHGEIPASTEPLPLHGQTLRIPANPAAIPGFDDGSSPFNTVALITFPSSQSDTGRRLALVDYGSLADVEPVHAYGDRYSFGGTIDGRYALMRVPGNGDLRTRVAFPGTGKPAVDLVPLHVGEAVTIGREGGLLQTQGGWQTEEPDTGISASHLTFTRNPEDDSIDIRDHSTNGTLVTLAPLQPYELL